MNKLKPNLDRYEKRPDNPVYEFESMSICEFAYCLRRITRKLPTLMTAIMMIIDDDNEPTDIARQTSCYLAILSTCSII
jgi:hypothetical protein